MMKLFTSLAIACSLASIPVVRSVDIPVTVGGPGLLKFTPEFVNANVGDTIVFTFKQKNHTITQSSLGEPCTPLAQGFDTGFLPVADNISPDDFPVATLTVKSTQPIWAFCRQGNHCRQGMIFAVNPGDKMDIFRSTATGNQTSTPTSAPSSTSPSGAVTVTETQTVTSTVTINASEATPTTTSPSSGVDHKVVVGDGGLVYNPPRVSAAVGDTITFEFRAKNHTITQSTFDQPCTSIGTGFDSGFIPVARDVDPFPTYTIRVNDTTPIWAFCRQGNHCATGMVFAVNDPASGNTFDAFKAKAISLATTQTASNSNAATSISHHGAGIMVVAITSLLVSLF